MWNRLFVYTFLSAAFFVALSGTIQKVLLLNHKDVGMHCNEGLDVNQPNLSHHISYHRHLVEKAESVVVSVVSLVNETYVD